MGTQVGSFLSLPGQRNGCEEERTDAACPQVVAYRAKVSVSRRVGLGRRVLNEKQQGKGGLPAAL